MTNTKTSCRACGTYLCATAICTICQEDIAWVCPACEMIENVTHMHNYCKVAYKDTIAVVADKGIAAESR